MSSEELFRQFTSESVTEGHPDKVCDQISDAILDDLLAQDPDSRVAVEALATRGLIHVAGEISTHAYCDIDGVVRQVLSDIGYVGADASFDAATCGVSISVGQQSPDIDHGVSSSWEQRHGSTDELDLNGAGDQGLMFGFACRETSELMPLPISAAHELARNLTAARREHKIPGLLPDGKTQITFGYDKNNVPRTVKTVVLSTQHLAEVDLQNELTPQVRELLIDPFLQRLAEKDLDISGVEVFVNPAGPFVLGGPAADTGLTGRKIIVDTYGGFARHGGGAFSGKDPSKVDRSAAYAARWIAKNVVAAELADYCEVQLAYAIGRAHPVGVYVDTFGSENVDPARIRAAIKETFDLRPQAIIRDLELRAPRYRATAAYGHFGRQEESFTWERTDRAEALKSLVQS